MICWWDDTEFVPHMFRLFSLKSYEAVLSFGNEKVQGSDRKELASRLREKVKEHFKPVD
jgi:hypothetical protein